jgi:NAD(P)-dependent dehydrogenase (short-subunit alcohol dehydrogenase family)
MRVDRFSLQGKVALVTGGNRGIGRAIALGLQAAGAEVAVTGRDAERNAAVGRELGDPSRAFLMDVRDEEAVQATVRKVVERWESLDILVNNAGIVHADPVLSLSRADWAAVLDTNLTGMFLCAKHAAAAMVDRGRGGKIINIASIYAIFGPPSFAAYGAAKAGVLGLSHALAVELGVHGIQVNTVLPGWTKTDMTEGMPTSPLGGEIRRRTPAGRWGEPEDMVGPVLFLASAASDFVSGAELVADGGYSVTERFIHE